MTTQDWNEIKLSEDPAVELDGPASRHSDPRRGHEAGPNNEPHDLPAFEDLPARGPAFVQ